MGKYLDVDLARSAHSAHRAQPRGNARIGGGRAPVAPEISLPGDLDVDRQVDQQTVRSAISHPEQRGLVVASKRGRTACYELSTEVGAILAEGEHRIFEPRRAAAD
jgi:PaaX-like protein